MRTILEPTDLLKAVLSHGRNGKPAARIVTANVLFAEDGSIITYTIRNEQLHIKNGGDVASLILRLAEGITEEPPAPPKSRRTA